MYVIAVNRFNTAELKSSAIWNTFCKREKVMVIYQIKSNEQ